MYDERVLERIDDWRDAYDIRRIGFGTTSSFVGTLDNGEEVIFKRGDEDFDEKHQNANECFLSSRNEVAWFVVSQIIGGEWRKVPPCIACKDWIFDRSQFQSTDYEFLEQDGTFRRFSFSGTVHYYQDRCTHDPHDLRRGTSFTMWADHIRMTMLDCLLHQVDRHPYNVLWDLDLVTSDDGTPRMYWIDNGRSFAANTRDPHEQLAEYWVTPPKLSLARTRTTIYRSACQLLEKWDEVTAALDAIGGRTEVIADASVILEMLAEQTYVPRPVIQGCSVNAQYNRKQWN